MDRVQRRDRDAGRHDPTRHDRFMQGSSTGDLAPMHGPIKDERLAASLNKDREKGERRLEIAPRETA